MAVSGAAAGEQKFRVWIRRRNEPQGPYAIRFEASDGKGILRVARPGVLVDPPARPGGIEERLTASQVRASRFLHVWDGGRYRQGHLLARLDEAGLEGLPADRWIQLVRAAEGTTALLLLPEEIGPDSGVVDDEPTWPRREMLAGLQRELRELGGGSEPDEFATEVRRIPDEARATAPVSRPSGVSRAEPVEIPRSPPPRPPPAAAPSLDDWLGAHAGDVGADDDRTVLMSGAALAALGNAPPPLPDLAVPRSVLAPRPEIPPDPIDDLTTIETLETIETFETIEAVEALEPEAVESLEAGADPEAEEALEAMEASEHTYDPGPPGEALEAYPAEEEEGEEREEREVTDFGRRAPETRPRGVLTEAVTVMPVGAQELAADAASSAHEEEPAAVVPSPPTRAPAPIERPAPRAAARPAAGQSPVAQSSELVEESVAEPSVPLGSRSAAADEPADAPDAAASLHLRSTTLVRHLRRRIAADGAQIAADRARIAVLEQRVSELEAELARRSSV